MRLVLELTPKRLSKHNALRSPPAKPFTQARSPTIPLAHKAVCAVDSSYHASHSPPNPATSTPWSKQDQGALFWESSFTRATTLAMAEVLMNKIGRMLKRMRIKSYVRILPFWDSRSRSARGLHVPIPDALGPSRSMVKQAPSLSPLSAYRDSLLMDHDGGDGNSLSSLPSRSKESLCSNDWKRARRSLRVRTRVKRVLEGGSDWIFLSLVVGQD